MRAAVWARQLFARPGKGAARAAVWQAEVAALHASLLRSAQRSLARSGGRAPQALDALVAYAGQPRREAQRQLLGHPQLVEALHELAPCDEAIGLWDGSVVPASRLDGDVEPDVPLGLARLGNVALPALLQRQPDWCGALEIASDAYGFVHFPGCAWSLALARRSLEELTPWSNARLHLVVDAEWVMLVPPGDEAPLLVVSRADFLRLIRGRYGQRWQPALRRRNPAARVRLQYTTRIARTRLEYEPIGRSDAEGGHLGLTGAILSALVEAFAANSPGMHRELLTYVRCIRGFELPDLAGGAVGSFSTPLRPGLMGFNVGYDAAGAPRLDPFSFTWLAHELAHNKNYLLDEVAYLNGCGWLTNGSQTCFVPRYHRALSLRTLFQVPYVHLYEAAALADFAAAGFAGVPWRIDVDWRAAGDDLLSEIDEAFTLLDQQAALTVWGQAALARQRQLAADFRRRWRSMRRAA